jgi:hypothetical protein
VTVAIRVRGAEDVPVVAGVLAAQQRSSGYPVRWPPPIPVDELPTLVLMTLDTSASPTS